jgi:hypothetical protein
MTNLFKSILTLFLIQASMPVFSQCTAPSNLSANYNNNVSTFTWDAVSGATDYIFEIKFAYDPWTSAGVLTANTNSLVLTGIMQSAILDWRVSTNCGTSVSSPTASTYTVPCPQPSAPNATNITGTSATVNWTAAPGYNTTTSNFYVSYRLANTSNAWISAGSTSSTSKTISGLTSNTSYEYCITQSCINSNSSPLIAQFTTAYIPCNIPTNLTITGASSSQATANWNSVSGGQSYTVEYKPTTSTTWTTTTSVTTNTNTLTGLAQATLYDVRVKATCTNGYVSNYVSNQFTTYTSTCPAYGVNGSEFIDLFSLGSISRTSGREIGGYRNTGLSTNLVKGSNTNAGVISGGYNPGIVFGENYAVYIDFNRNGSFADNGERVAGPTYFATGSSLNFNVAIPNNASTGSTKMRVIVRRSTSSMAPCATGFQGEVEDYNVTIVSNHMVAATDNQNVKGVSIYPNPSNGKFSISTSDDFIPASYEIIGLDNRIIERQVLNGDKTTALDLSSHSDGVYILNILSTDNKKSANRIVLMK